MNAPRLIPLAELHEDPQNARTHDARNRAAVRASLQDFGQVETLVVQKGTGRVLGGNCRLGELRALGAVEAWCIEVDVDGPDATRLALILNRTAELAAWDPEQLRAALVEIGDGGSFWTAAETRALFGPEDAPTPTARPDRPATTGTFAVLVTCEDERHQRALLEELAERGLNVRAWML